ncbi:c-type cytochrome [Massilia sp. Root351]|uniref:c-type cytochrome n=1 Tax=Massilia sp. Root351 TaxID=1736522 RepID=UPI001E2CA4EC|nr:c-type cytochrome [Massilia sp. Root351]
MLKTMAATTAGLAALGALGAYLLVESGWYNVAANEQHLQPVHSLLERAMHQSVRRYASATSAPPLDEPELIRRGAALYRSHCVVCHGGPGVAQEKFGQSMQPVPGPLVDAARRWQPAEMYWIIRHGIKMSGMPAWEYHMAEQDLWATVAFVAEMPRMTPATYSDWMAQATGSGAAAGHGAQGVLPGRPERGRAALTQYACQACHMIPGVTGSRVYVGPPLQGIAGRALIAGRLPNSAASMALWMRDPRHVQPGTAMPVLGVSEQDAVDIAAYLQTLH